MRSLHRVVFAACVLNLGVLLSDTQQSTFPVGSIGGPVDFPEDLLDYSMLYYRGGGSSPNLQQRVGYKPSGHGFKVAWQERDPGGAWSEEFTIQVSFAYRLTCAAWREGGNDVYVAGLRDNGEAIVQRFQFPVRDGGYYLSSDQAPAGIGTPLAPYQAQQFLKGTTFRPPDDRSYSNPARSRIMGDEIGVIQAMEVDPYGRFLLLLTFNDSKLYRLDLSSGELAFLYDDDDIPRMEDLNVRGYRFGTGHAYVMGRRQATFSSDHPPRTVLVDDDNDGVVDSVLTHATKDASIAAGFGSDALGRFWMVDVAVSPF